MMPQIMSQNMTQIMLQTHNLTKKYGDLLALDSVSLTLRRGDIYGLVGRNGAGKTTFFKCVMGLANPNAGEVELLGEKTNLNATRRHLNAVRRRMGFMINPSFFPYLNPYENLRYLCRVKGVQDQGEVDRLLKLVGLNGVNKPFKAFSLGMKHRLGIAGALLGSPDVVVLDEPVNGLDPQGIIDMRTVIKDIHSRTGATFIISSHILSELDLVATRFGFIEQGVLLKEISHEDLHGHTKKSLLIDVDDIQKAQAALQAIGIRDVPAEGNRLTLDPDTAEALSLARSSENALISENARSSENVLIRENTLISENALANEIVRALVNGGVELYGLRWRETTLEEYFVRLVGGLDD